MNVETKETKKGEKDKESKEDKEGKETFTPFSLSLPLSLSPSPPIEIGNPIGLNRAAVLKREL
jgi:hypothetical protein